MPNTAAELTERASRFLDRAEHLLERLESGLPSQPATPDWATHSAFRWRRQGRQGWIEAIAQPQRMEIGRLDGIEAQKQQLLRNTAQFVAGHPANNVLLTGARGTGKSSLVKAMLPLFSGHGLRIIEVDKSQLADLADITPLLAGQPWRFILFCDDLGFDHDDNGYMALKVALDGSLAATPDNVLIYATSNRRHLMPEFLADNQSGPTRGAEVHPNETVEEKTSLSDRFGLWLSFWPFDQDTYLACVGQWVDAFGLGALDADTVRREALQWAQMRGTRSGRSAWQFVRDLAGRTRLTATGTAPE